MLIVCMECQWACKVSPNIGIFVSLATFRSIFKVIVNNLNSFFKSTLLALYVNYHHRKNHDVWSPLLKVSSIWTILKTRIVSVNIGILIIFAILRFIFKVIITNTNLSFISILLALYTNYKQRRNYNVWGPLFKVSSIWTRQ